MKKSILPIVAVAAVVIAIIVLVAVPKGGNAAGSAADASNDIISVETSGDLRIDASELSSKDVSFIKIADFAEGSRIELLARIGDDGQPKIALGTCQSCNGSPGAYYTMEGNSLKCNNCGLTFPLNILDGEGGGCHPIKVDEIITDVDKEGITLDLDALLKYEALFDKVAEH